jgi:hypothetical protein
MEVSYHPLSDLADERPTRGLAVAAPL